ncbi:Uncharacterised protein [Vibrio cholerae]|nr:Uncharacterised protein [Vibrio cholerae]
MCLRKSLVVVKWCSAHLRQLLMKFSTSLSCVTSMRCTT